LEWAGAKDGMEVHPAVVSADGDIGQSYVAGVELGGLYAYAGREWVVERMRQIIGAAVTDSVHNHHNFAWRETHGDRELWVVRKGATPAFPGQRGLAGEWTRQPRFTRKQMDAWLKEKHVLLRGGDVDESPMVYRRLPDVLREHDGTIKVLHTLRPFAGAMAGPGEFDPYKD
jgi:tRNA-splicing ligase RtcB (3'-phosphate/5'-hydroxy nucleic acid ligase)